MPLSNIASSKNYYDRLSRQKKGYSRHYNSTGTPVLSRIWVQRPMAVDTRAPYSTCSTYNINNSTFYNIIDASSNLP